MLAKHPRAVNLDLDQPGLRAFRLQYSRNRNIFAKVPGGMRAGRLRSVCNPIRLYVFVRLEDELESREFDFSLLFHLALKT